MDKKRKKIFNIFFVGMMLICVLVFVTLTLFMSNRTKQSISEISDIYMSEMNVQLQQKFESIINLRMEQVDSIISRTPPTSQYNEEDMEQLRISAEVRNFSSLIFYRTDGTMETIYGEEPELLEEDTIDDKLTNYDRIVTRGLYQQDERVLILGKPASYRMSDGGYSDALLIGISMDYLNQAMFLEEDNTMLYTHITDIDGNFIIRNGDAYVENYLSRIERVAKENNGKTGTDIVRELKTAMDTRENYSETILTEEDKRQIYCSPVSDDVDWYLITVMHDSTLDEVLTKLDKFRLNIMFVSSLVILLTMMCIFIVYYKLSQQQMVELNKARHEAQSASKAKSEFLSSMSHDIRTPMNAIIGMTDIAINSIEDTEKLDKCLQKIKLSSKHLLGLINDVLDMSKIESGKMILNIIPVSLREAMDDIVNIVQPQVKSKNQYFDIFIKQISSENVYCDGVRLNQVLLNLLSNAVKYTPEGGRIDIYMHQEDSPKGEEYVRTHIRVVDTGIGMSPEFQKKIFDTFTREENEQVSHILGTGLGMAITNSIVNLMGGTIELNSEKDKGSDFHVILDLKRVNESDDIISLPPWKVLVVDDNEPLCLSAVENLMQLGIQAEWTMDGMEAVKMVEERHKNNDDYDFVLIDWKMPNMDGIETIHEIRKRVDDKIPVFLISAYDWIDIEEHARSEVIEGFIPKPLFKSTLYEHLRQYIDGHEARTETNSEPEVDFTGKHVLLAEDMDLNWEVAYEILSSIGLELERAENGQECLEMFEKSEVGYYDAILMDIRMPIMNGYDATQAIHKLDRPDNNIPIIAMTADAFSDDAKHCLECGMVAHIPKPIDIKECIRVLQKYLK